MSDNRDITVEYDIQVIGIRNITDLKLILQKNYMKQLENMLGDEKKAMKFLSAVVADVQRNPKLLECTPPSLLNAYVTMASVGFMPSAVSGEAYVIPYSNSKKTPDGKYEKVLEAQFQMGYQGLVTLFYTAGVQRISGGIVREKDKTTFINGELTHEVPLNLSKTERGEPIGAYVTVTFRDRDTTKYMNGKDILEHARKFSKSYDPDGAAWKYSPWNPANDPENTMWLKTVLKQMSKLLPKNENINRAIAADNEESRMTDRIAEARKASESLKMGNLLTGDAKAKKTKKGKENQTSTEPTSGNGVVY